MGVMGGAGRQGGEGGDHRCRAEPAPQPTRSRSAGVEESAADAALAPRNLSPFPGDGAGPRSSSGDALPAATQETRGQRGGFAKPAPRTRPVLYPGGAPRPRRHDTHSRDSPPTAGAARSTGERERKLVCSTICWKTKTSDSLLHMQRNNTASPIDNQGDIKKTTVLQRPNSTS